MKQEIELSFLFFLSPFTFFSQGGPLMGPPLRFYKVNVSTYDDDICKQETRAVRRCF